MRADLLVQLLVEAQPHARGARDELDGAVVVRRAEPTGDDAEVGACDPFGERPLSSSSRSPTIEIRAGSTPSRSSSEARNGPFEVACGRLGRARSR